MIGSIISAAAFGAIVGLLGRWLTTTTRPLLLLAILGILSTVYALGDIGFVRLPYPQNVVQVPVYWRNLFHPYVAALYYGIGLGFGVSTRIVTGALYVVLAGVFLSADPLQATFIFCFFGLGRGGSILVIGWKMRTLQSAEDFHPALLRLESYNNRVQLVASLILTFAGGYWLSNFILSLASM